VERRSRTRVLLTAATAPWASSALALLLATSMVTPGTALNLRGSDGGGDEWTQLRRSAFKTAGGTSGSEALGASNAVGIPVTAGSPTTRASPAGARSRYGFIMLTVGALCFFSVSHFLPVLCVTAAFSTDTCGAGERWPWRPTIQREQHQTAANATGDVKEPTDLAKCPEPSPCPGRPEIFSLDNDDHLVVHTPSSKSVPEFHRLDADSDHEPVFEPAPAVSTTDVR